MSEYMIFWDDGQISKVAANGFRVESGMVIFLEVGDSHGVEEEVGIFLLNKLCGSCRVDNLSEITEGDE